MPRKLTTAQFIEKSKNIFGDIYDYSKTIYNTCRTPVILTCKTCGDFEQHAGSHLHNKNGCPKCYGRQKSTEEFITEAHIAHGYKYDYSLSQYKGSRTRLIVVCPTHGQFEVEPNNHLVGLSGCPDCAENGFKESKPAVFYIYVSDTFIGFGITNNLKRRIKAHRVTFKAGNVVAELHSTYNMSGKKAFALERDVKKQFREDILNTKLEGFKTEAVDVTKLSPLISYIDIWLKENNFADL